VWERQVPLWDRLNRAQDDISSHSSISDNQRSVHHACEIWRPS
jgi:hypothetical protein